MLSIGFLGAGMMASALMDGLVSKKITDSNGICCSDLYEKARLAAAAKGIKAFENNGDVCQTAKDVLIVAVKPNVVPAVCKDISSHDSSALIVSVAAGVSLQALQSALPEGRRVVRVMTNTPCLVGEGATCFALGTYATDEDRNLVSTIFQSVGGVTVEVQEELLDAVTGLSGSGPAYVYQFIEALSDGGVRSGLPRDVATRLAAQTVKGAAEMVLETGKHPGALKDAVTSPGGTTIAGVEALENGGMRSSVISAVKAATKRSMQLGGLPKDHIEQKSNL